VLLCRFLVRMYQAMEPLALLLLALVLLLLALALLLLALALALLLLHLLFALMCQGLLNLGQM